MTFVCTLLPGEYRSAAVKCGSSYVVTELIGFDDAEDVLYELRVTLEPHGGGNPEITFWIEALDSEGRTLDVMWSGLRTGFIRGEDRRLVLHHVLIAIRHLLAEAKPDIVYMCTVDEYPPEKAKRKFVAIARLFETCGYKPARYDEYHGQCLWEMERAPKGDVDSVA